MTRTIVPDDVLCEVFEHLLERFGEPISKVVPTVGIADEGPGKKKTYKDKAAEKPWNTPEVVHEADTCEMCEDELDEMKLGLQDRGGYAPSDWSSEDYEECGECGFNHRYEREEANSWHREHKPMA